MKNSNTFAKKTIPINLKKTAFKPIPFCLFVVLFLVAIYLKSSGGNITPVTCPPVAPFTGVINTAADLKRALASLCGNKCNSPVILRFGVNKIISLGDLAISDFPLYVPPGVVLQGDFMINNCVSNKSYGTVITFPYLFENGFNCAGVGANVLASAFIMDVASEMHNIRLIGARSGDTGVRWQSQQNMCLGEIDPGSSNFYGDLPVEGIASGIIAVGNKIRITNCEIQNFNLFGAQVREMVQNGTPPATTQPCYTSPAPGEFYFERNYVHNCKVNGYGYGLWISNGSSFTKCIPLVDPVYYCVPPGENPQLRFYNFEAPVEVATIKNNYFSENQHDIDGSFYRSNMMIDSCSFSERAGFNVTRHRETLLVCYPNFLAYAVGNNLAPCDDPDPLKWPQPCRENLSDIGGHRTEVTGSVFYKPLYNIEIPYPNINKCDNTINSPGLNDPTVYINGNCFNTLFDNTTQSEEQRISLAHSWHTEWNYKPNMPNSNYPNDDTYVSIGEDVLKPNNFDQFYQNITPPKAPVAIIASTEVGSGIPANDQPKEIWLGSKIDFESILCSDGDGNLMNGNINQNHCVLMYRFHELSEDEAEEVRVNPGQVVTHTFNYGGIVNINLVIIDVKTGMMSNIATQQITVNSFIPGNPHTLNKEMILSFSYKDTHTDATLVRTAACGNGYYDIRSIQPAYPPTNFEIYAMVDNVLVWSEDIAGDRGWQKAVVDLKQFFNPPFYSEHTLEIGLRAVADAAGNGPDASRVRGVKFYIDDIYLDGWKGDNCILNGDLEITKSPATVSDPYPLDIADWDLIQEGDFNLGTIHGTQDVRTINLATYSCASPPGFAMPAGCTSMFLESNSGVLSTNEVRSGHTSYEGIIRPLNYLKHNCPVGATATLLFSYYTGLQYNPGYYKAIQTMFHRNPEHKTNGNQLEFSILPNPSLSGKYPLVLIKEKSKTVFTLMVTDLLGKIVFNGQTYNNSVRLNNKFNPGIYYVTISNGEKADTQRMVITK